VLVYERTLGPGAQSRLKGGVRGENRWDSPPKKELPKTGRKTLGREAKVG